MNNKGCILTKLGKYQEAIESYDKALEINPNDFDAWNNKGHALKDSGRYQEAITSYDKALKINPDFEPALKAKEEIYKQY